MIRRTRFLLLLAAFAGVSLWALAQPGEADLDANRRKLEQLREHPEQLTRLRENFQQYQALPAARREAINKLDRDLHALSKMDHERLAGVLGRYADWLDQLRQSDPRAYEAIHSAPDAATRFTLIKNQRDREWLITQPKATRERWQKLDADGRAALVLQLRREQREKRERWILTGRFWAEVHAKKSPLPARLADLSQGVRDYVDNFLMPHLSAEEKKRLADAEGRWPDYPRALVEIASRRPPALPPMRKEDWPRKVIDLPAPVRQRLLQKKGADKKGAGKARMFKELKNFEGPNFASKVAAIALRERKMPLGHEYLACNHISLMLPMQKFVDNQLIPALKDHQADRRRFTDSEGKWPDYPLTIQELSEKYRLNPPWHYLPEPDRWKWDLYRNPRSRSETKGK